ncbi:MAG TPA: hypothetical protein VN763_13440, partial [Saprospiraceae bacterium]|nr:hypothetical protein [Saprospiraceae bacterium]
VVVVVMIKSITHMKKRVISRPQHRIGEPSRELGRVRPLQLYSSPEWVETNNTRAALKFDLSRHRVSLIPSAWWFVFTDG